MDELEDDIGLPRPRRQLSEIAVLGGHEDDLTIAGGYLKVAEVAAMYWIEHGPDDSMPIPILYNYRHAIELTLKWLIRLAARYLVEGGYTEENLSPEKLDRKLDTHNVKQLADRLDRYLGLLEIRAPDNRIDRASRQLLDWLDSEDETGQSFRYAVVHDKHGPRAARPDQVNVNFYEQLKELHQVAKLLFDGYTGWLDDYEAVQQDYQEWLRSQGPCPCSDASQSCSVSRAADIGRDPAAVLEQVAGQDADAQDFWDRAERNLRGGVAALLRT